MAKVKHNPDAKKLIDEYINSLPDFSKAICKKLRILILKADKGIIEDWKWGPNYYYEGMICGYGGFKKHVALAFFQGAAMKDPYGIMEACTETTVHNRRIYLYDVKDINEKAIIEYVKEAIELNKKGIKVVVKDKTVIIPDDFKSALNKAKVLKDLESQSYSHKKEYVEWITSAKREETRKERIAKAVAMISKGEGRHDKYKKK